MVLDDDNHVTTAPSQQLISSLLCTLEATRTRFEFELILTGKVLGGKAGGAVWRSWRRLSV